MKDIHLPIDSCINGKSMTKQNSIISNIFVLVESDVRSDLVSVTLDLIELF